MPTALALGTAFAFVLALGMIVTCYGVLKHAGVLDLREDATSFITKLEPPDNTVVLDARGKKIGEFFDNYHVFIPYERIPENLKSAILATEDRHFWTHQGYDLKAMLRAALVYVRHRRFEQGASTLTQQLVRHFLLTSRKSIDRKVLEIVLAARLERQLSKKRIFELYANEMFLGNGAYGVGAAALRYFGKPVEQLDLPEAALIAGLFQSPSAYNPQKYPRRAKARQRTVLLAMVGAGVLTRAQAEAAYAKGLKFAKYVPARTQSAPYFIDYIESEAKQALGKDRRLRDDGLRIHTTLDGELQQLAEEAVRDADPLIEKRVREAMARNARQVSSSWHPDKIPQIEVALLAVDPRDGRVLAMVGGRNYAANEFNRVASALRSPGSAFKPVVYSLALERGWKWSDVLYVEPITIDNYRPRNVENDYLTETTLLRAFYRSMNTPAVELGSRLGIAAVLEQAKKLGVRSALKPEIGTVIGGSDVTMWDLARLYGVFANGGNLVEPVSITRIEDRHGKPIYKMPELTRRSNPHVVSSTVAYLMTEGMRAVLQHGTAYDSRELAEVSAGKTGTSNNSTDNWFCGYTPELLTLVWVGTDDNTPLPPDSHGATLALPIWDDFMRKALKIRPPSPFPRPDSVISAQVHPLYGYRVSSGGVQMFFRKGEEPTATPSAIEAVSGHKRYRSIFDDQ